MMNRLNRNTKMWRRTKLFFAAFFCLSIGATSCKKKFNPNGKDVLPPGSIMSSGGIDTFKVHTYTELEDSINSMDPEFNLLGSYNDPVFGKMEASFYTQLTLSGFSPDFGDLNDLVIDSAIMAFEYGGYYGKLNTQLFEAYEILDDLSRDSSYLRTSTVQVGTQNIVATGNNEGLIKPNTDKPAIVGNDTLKPQLRLPIDHTFARHLLEVAQTATSDNTFLEEFKGLHFKVNNPTFSSGEGGILYLATSKAASKLTVYFTVDNKQSKFDFIITNKAVDFNHIEVDNTNTKVEQVLNDPSLGDEEFYAQAFISRAKIEFESINDLPKNIIVHEATLEIPTNYFEGDPHYISGEVIASAKLFEDDERKYVVQTVAFNKSKKAYVINVRTYVQNILKGEIQNNGIYLSPKRYNTSAERIIFNGANSTYKKQPKLNIVYTEL